MPPVHHLPAGDRQALLERLSRALAERGEIVFAYVHGSILRPDGFRDIDVAVWTSETAGPRTDVELATDLSRDIGYPVDVRVVNRAPVAFLFHALRGRPLVVRDERFLADLIERTARTYHDHAPLARRATREAFAG